MLSPEPAGRIQLETSNLVRLRGTHEQLNHPGLASKHNCQRLIPSTKGVYERKINRYDKKTCGRMDADAQKKTKKKCMGRSGQSTITISSQNTQTPTVYKLQNQTFKGYSRWPFHPGTSCMSSRVARPFAGQSSASPRCHRPAERHPEEAPEGLAVGVEGRA